MAIGQTTLIASICKWLRDDGDGCDGISGDAKQVSLASQ